MAFTSPSYWTLKRKAKALVDEKLQLAHSQGLHCWDSQTETPTEEFEDCQSPDDEFFDALEFTETESSSDSDRGWYRDGLSWWPPHTEKTKLLRCVRAKETPNECAGWTQHRARVLYESDSLDKVVRKWNTSCDTSDLNSDHETCRKSKPKKQFALLDSSPLRKHPSTFSQSGNTANKKKKLSFLPPLPTPPPVHQPVLSSTKADLVTPGPYSTQSRTLTPLAHPVPGETEGDSSLEYTDMQPSREQRTSDDRSLWERSDTWSPQYDVPSRTRLPTGQLIPSQCTPTERILLQMLGELQSQVQHLTEIVTQRPPFLGNSPAETPLTMCAEDGGLPLQDTEELKNIEMQLGNVEFKNKLVSKLSVAGGQTLKKTVWRICGKVFAPQLAVNLNWCGRGDKTAMRNTNIVGVIIQSALRNPLLSAPNEAEAEKTIKEWLRLSRHRLTRRMR